jgi:DnaJ-class molecular chaperone
MSKCGYYSGKGTVHCKRCSGKGYINPFLAGKGRCPDCKGDGKVKCSHCNGSGRK